MLLEIWEMAEAKGLFNQDAAHFGA